MIQVLVGGLLVIVGIIIGFAMAHYRPPEGG